jgi:hypothetical protein
MIYPVLLRTVSPFTNQQHDDFGLAVQEQGSPMGFGGINPASTFAEIRFGSNGAVCSTRKEAHHSGRPSEGDRPTKQVRDLGMEKAAISLS